MRIVFFTRNFYEKPKTEKRLRHKKEDMELPINICMCNVTLHGHAHVLLENLI